MKAARSRLTDDDSKGTHASESECELEEGDACSTGPSEAVAHDLRSRNEEGRVSGAQKQIQ